MTSRHIRLSRQAFAPVIILSLACGGSNPATGDAPIPGLALPPESEPGLECERKDFPCSWLAVDSAVRARSIAVGREALGRSRSSGIPAARAWLESVEGIAEVLADSAGLVFRLRGGRRVWVETAPDDGRFGAGAHGAGPPAASAAMPPPFNPPAAAPPGSIVGEDRNGDDKVNQRDQRRALVLDPYLHEVAFTGYTGGPRVAALLEKSEAYAGQVTLQVDNEISLASYQGWAEYDLITVFSHSGVKCAGNDCAWLLWLGIHLDPSLAATDVAALRAWLEPIGLELRVRMADVKRKTVQAGDSLYWSVGASADFFRHTYPRGLDRKIIVIGSCSSMDPAMILAMTGPPRSDASTYFGFTNLVEARDAEGAVSSFLDLMVDQGLSARQSYSQLRKRGLTRFVDDEGVTEFVGHMVRNPRAREIIRLVDAKDTPLRDGADLDSLVGGSIGDRVPDSLTVTALVEGVITGNEDAGLVDHSTGSEVVHMEAWLELDGKRIGRTEGLLDKPKRGNVIRVDFKDVPVGFDLRKDQQYELEAVLLLPSEKDEEGESRYSVRLSGASCSWRISYQGARDGRYTGNHVIHMFDNVSFDPSPDRRTWLTRQIAFQKRGSFALTIAFGADGLPLGRTGSFVLGAEELRGERLTLDVDLDFPWQNRMTGENRTFSVRIDRNDREVLAGSFQGGLLNVPRRAPLPDPVDHGDVSVEGEFVWRRGQCRPDR
jgi:hypothetical protein